MLMGRALLQDLGMPLAALDHRSFDEARRLVEERGEDYYQAAVDKLVSALENCTADSRCRH